nr:uncharacterized protein LOC109169483 [Ipomoea trifida]
MHPILGLNELKTCSKLASYEEYYYYLQGIRLAGQSSNFPKRMVWQQASIFSVVTPEGSGFPRVAKKPGFHNLRVELDKFQDVKVDSIGMQEESKEDMRNKILAMLEELKQDITHMRQECKQEIMQEFATQRQEISSLWQETQASIKNLEDQITQVVMWENEWENTCVEERNVGNGVVEKEIKEESGEDDEDVQIVCRDELYFGKTLEA